MRTVSPSRVIAFAVVAILLLAAGIGVGAYNQLVRLDQAARAQWAQVENAYQRRADLVPNLVETVKGAAEFERGTLAQVTEARSRVGQLATSRDVTSNAEAFGQFQAAQDRLGGALSRLLVIAEANPALTATQAFRDLQAQLEGSENRIAVERMRYNAAAREFDTTRATFPVSIVAGIFAARFTEKPYFTARPGSAEPPKVRF